MAGEHSDEEFKFVPDEDSAKLIEAEAILEGVEPKVIVGRAIGVYLELASEMREGSKLVLLSATDKDVPDTRASIFGLSTVSEIRMPWLIEGKPDEPEPQQS